MKKAITLILTITLCLSLCACGKAGDYEAAVALMDAGNYEEAIVAFTELGDYEDSAQKLEECENILAYAEAIALFEAEQYEDALAIFTALGDYQDSLEKKLECENALAYQNALDLIASGDYENAYTTLVGLGDYKDVPELLTHFKEVEITTENWSEYFVVVEEPEYIKNDFNENVDIQFAYYLTLNEDTDNRIFKPSESKVIFEFTYDTVIKDVQFEKAIDKYEVLPANPIFSTDVYREISTLTWEKEMPIKEPLYSTTVMAAAPAPEPGTEPETPPTAWFLAENFEATRTQGSIFIYE